MWAKEIGDREIMRGRITESRWARFWAEEFGDKEIMIDRITESDDAYLFCEIASQILHGPICGRHV
jgi:hypothetical protein